MNNFPYTKVALNFFSVVLLVATIATPIYFASNFAKVAGVKSESKYLIVSQVENFPNLTFSQSGELYTINFQKFGPNQAFLGVLLLNNPTEKTQTYKLQFQSQDAAVFFGKDINSQDQQIKLPQNSSVPISLIGKNQEDFQKIDFRLEVQN